MHTLTLNTHVYGITVFTDSFSKLDFKNVHFGTDFKVYILRPPKRCCRVNERPESI